MKNYIVYANEKYANYLINIFCHFSERACQYLSPDTLLMKMGSVVTFGVSQTRLFKYIKNMA